MVTKRKNVYANRTNKYIDNQLRILSNRLWRRRRILADSKAFLNSKEKLLDLNQIITEMPNDWSEHPDFNTIMKIMPKVLPNMKYDEFTLTFDAQYGNYKTGRVNFSIEIPGLNKDNVINVVKNIIFEYTINPTIEEPVELPGMRKVFTDIVDEEGKIQRFESLTQNYVDDFIETEAQEISNANMAYVGIKGIVGIQLENPNNPMDIINVPLNEFKHNYGLGEIVNVEKDCLKITLEDMWKAKDLPEGGITITQAIEFAKELKKNIRFFDKNDNLIASHVHSTHKPIPGIYVVDSSHIEIKTKTKTPKVTFVKDIKTPLFTLLNNKNIPIVNKFDRRDKEVTSYTWEDSIITLDPFYNFRETLKVPSNQSTLNYMMDKINKKIGFDYSSAYNQQTLLITKDLQFGGIMKNFYKGKDLVAIDKIQFYTNILMTSSFEVPIFDICDQVSPYEEGDEIKPGLYLCDDGWKFHNCITSTPTLKIYSSDSINIRHIAKGFKDVPKDIINAVIGCWQKSSMFKSRVILSGDYDDARRYMTNEMSRVELLKDTDIYFTQNFEKNLKFRNHRMVVGIIIQYSHVEIMKTKLALEKLGHKIYEIRTDSFLIENFKGITNEFLKTHKCDKVKDKHGNIKKLNTIFTTRTINQKVEGIFDEDVDITHIEPEWINYKTTDIDHLISTGESFILTGEAGTGKSYHILNTISEVMKKYNINYKVAAFTHAAASNVHGITLHDLLNLDKDCNYNNKKDKMDFTYIIIDEFTQVPFKIWEYLYSSRFDNISFIIVGDYRQLSPIQSNEYVKRRLLKNPKASDIYYREFDNMLDLRFIKEMANNNLIMLTEVYRYYGNPTIIEKTKLNKKDNYDIILTYSRADANNINKIMFEKFKNKFVDDVQVIHNQTKNRYRIKGEDCIPINENDNKIIKFNENDFSVNFANTIYTSQGQGYNKYAVLNYDQITGKNKYVVDTRRKKEIIHNLKI